MSPFGLVVPWSLSELPFPENVEVGWENCVIKNYTQNHTDRETMTFVTSVTLIHHKSCSTLSIDLSVSFSCFKKMKKSSFPFKTILRWRQKYYKMF